MHYKVDEFTLFSDKRSLVHSLQLIIRNNKPNTISYLMGIKESLKKVIHKTDMLSASPTLRIRSSQSVETLFGGMLSLVIIVALSVIFFQSLINVLNKIDISSQESFEDDPTSAVDITSFQFAIGIDGQDFTANLQRFQVNLVQFSVQDVNGAPSKSFSPIPLSICNVSDWKDIGTHFQKQFYGFGMDKMYCLSPTKNISLYGYDGGLPYRFLTLQIRMCNNSIPGCDSTANVQSSMTSHLNTNNLFRVRLFIVNTLFSPSKNNPISRVVEKNLLLSFTSTTATVGYIYMGDYTVTTDESIFLVTQNKYQTGTYIDTSTTTTIPMSGVSNYLISMNIYKSTKSLTIVRSYGKIDSLLSYIGGLFGIILSAVSYFFASYSSHCYELAIAEACFSLDENGRKYREKNFTFLTYIKYSLYDWLSCCGMVCNWSNMQQIANLKEEVQSQIDISVILRRIRHLQCVSKILMSEHRYLSLYLATPPTLQQSKKMKEAISYYDELLQRLQENREIPMISKQKVSNQLTQIQIVEEGGAVRERMPRQILFNQTNDRMFVQALGKLKGDADYYKFCELIGKKITDGVGNDVTMSNIQSGVFEKLQMGMQIQQL